MKSLLSLAVVFAILAWMASLNMAHAGDVVINNYQVQEAPSGRFCWGLVGCLIMHALDEQDRQAQAPHPCNVWNGRQYVRATCAP